MSRRTPTAVAERPAPTTPSSPADRAEVDPGPAFRRASLVAGAAVMLVAVTGAFGNVVVIEGMVTPGDAATTADDITAADGLFRLGVVSLYLAVVFDVVVAWALMRVFRPVSASLSRLAGWFRLAYSAVFLVSISHLAGIPQLLGSQAHADAFAPDQLQALALQKVETFEDVWFAGLILFGVHLALLGYLAYRSGFVPRVIGVLLVVAGAGYAYDSIVTVFVDGSPFAVSQVTFLGEFLLGLWLLLRGSRLATPRSSS